MNLERRDLFNRAADLLEKEAWIKGSMYAPHEETGGNAYCMVGALRMIQYGSPYPDGLEEDEASETYGGISGDTMIHFNDEVAETASEVIERLREMGAGKWSSWEEWQE